MRRLGHRPSTIDKLDPEIKRMIADLRLEHGWSIDQIKAKLDEMAQPVSRSALARHTKSIEEIGRELRHSREVARALVEQAGPGDDSKIADLNIELAHGLVLRLMTATEGGELMTYSPEDAMFLSRTLSGLASAKKTDTDRRRKDREEEREAAAGRAEKVMKSSGFSADTVLAIRLAVLGGEG